MNLYTFLANVIYNTIATGYGFIISGYNNDTGEDHTDGLAFRIESIYRDIDEQSKPVVFPCNGVWQGQKERSLLVLFPNVISTDNPVVETLMATVRVLAECYSQYEVITIQGGRFHAYNRPNNTVTLIGDIAKPLSLEKPDAYTEVFFDPTRQEQEYITKFTIESTPEIQAEIEAAKQPLDIPKSTYSVADFDSGVSADYHFER